MKRNLKALSLALQGGTVNAGRSLFIGSISASPEEDFPNSLVYGFTNPADAQRVMEVLDDDVVAEIRNNLLIITPKDTAERPYFGLIESPTLEGKINRLTFPTNYPFSLSGVILPADSLVPGTRIDLPFTDEVLRPGMFNGNPGVFILHFVEIESSATIYDGVLAGAQEISFEGEMQPERDYYLEDYCFSGATLVNMPSAAASETPLYAASYCCDNVGNVNYHGEDSNAPWGALALNGVPVN